MSDKQTALTEEIKGVKDVIDWQLQIERLAGDIYREAAERFSEDGSFSNFMAELADEEDIHFKLIENAEKNLLDKKEYPVSAIMIDQDIKERVEIPLRDLYEQIISAHRINKKALMKIIVNVEFAELNNIFIYVLSSLQNEDQEIRQITEIVRSHTERIKSFIDEHYDDLDISDLIKKLPVIGKKKILIIDEHMPTRLFMARMLEEFGKIEIASSSQEALKMLDSLYFDVIVSDIDMPVMDGIEIFMMAIKASPNIADHFVFYTDTITEDIKSLCKTHNIICMKKPFGINQLFKAVQTTMDRKH